MILPDVNLLVYAYNADAPHHIPARAWWESVVNGDVPIRLPWAVVVGFIRLMTHRRVVQRPLDPAVAVGHVRSWLQRDNVRPLEPGPRHLDIIATLLGECGVAGSLTTDAHLAALAIEYNCELHSNDVDFGRFSGLRWCNPLRL